MRKLLTGLGILGFMALGFLTPQGFKIPTSQQSDVGYLVLSGVVLMAWFIICVVYLSSQKE